MLRPAQAVYTVPRKRIHAEANLVVIVERAFGTKEQRLSTARMIVVKDFDQNFIGKIREAVLRESSAGATLGSCTSAC